MVDVNETVIINLASVKTDKTEGRTNGQDIQQKIKKRTIGLICHDDIHNRNTILCS